MLDHQLNCKYRNQEKINLIFSNLLADFLQISLGKDQPDITLIERATTNQIKG